MTSKAVERAVLAVCVQRIPGFPAESATDHEHPDFLITYGRRVVGIEMQEYIQEAHAEGGAPQREGESLRAMVMRVAQKEFEAAHPSNFLYVYGHWHKSAVLENVPAIASKVSALVAGLMPSPPDPGQGISRRDATYEEIDRVGLAGLLLALDVHLFPPATYGVWASPEAGRYSTDLADLERQIHAKDAKLGLYRESCNEVWLVVYSLALPSGAFDLEALAGVSFTSPFDHVVFLETVSGNFAVLAGR